MTNFEQLVDLIVEILGNEALISNCVITSCSSSAVSGQQVTLANNITAVAFCNITPGECIAFREDETGVWYVVSTGSATKQEERVIRYRRHKVVDNPTIAEPKIKTLFKRENNFYLGGYIKQPKNIYNSNLGIGYTTNLGGKNYLTSLRQQDNYWFISPTQNTPTFITNSITHGEEYFLGNGFWESNANVPGRVTIANQNVYPNPVNFSSTPLSDAYGRALSLSQVNAYADTWTPENPHSRFSYTRNLLNVTYEPPEPEDPDTDKGMWIYFVFPQNNFYYSETTVGDYYEPEKLLYEYSNTSYNISNLQIENGERLVTISLTSQVALIQDVAFGALFVGQHTVEDSYTRSYTLELIGGETYNLWDGSSYYNFYNPYIDIPWIITSNEQIYNDYIQNNQQSLNQQDESQIPGTIFIYDFNLGGNEPPIFSINSPYRSESFSYSYTGEDYWYGKYYVWDILKQKSAALTTQTFRLFFPYNPSDPPPMLPPKVKEENYLEKYSGTFIVQKTASGYLYQDLDITRKITINRKTNVTTIKTTVNQSRLRLVYKNKNITLNTNDFLVVHGWNLLSPITEDSQVFGLTSTTSTDTQVNISAFLGQPVLFNLLINDIPCLVRGVINFIGYRNDTLSLRCSITKFQKNTKTSFLGRLILDNGSFYNYYFRNTLPISANFACKSVMSTIIFNPVAYAFIPDDSLFAVGYNLTTDNIVDERIYSVVEIKNTTALVESWQISSNGNVNFSKLFKSPYYSIGENATVFTHSYHPK